jgi:hypothetical protein
LPTLFRLGGWRAVIRAADSIVLLVSLCTLHEIRVKEEAMPDVQCDYCHDEKDSTDMYFCPKCRMWVCWNCAKHSGMSTGTWCPMCGELLEEQK